MLPLPDEVLPHRHPFLFLTQVTEMESSQYARGYWDIEQEPFFGGHFPGRPTLPGVIMVESLAQLGAYLVLSKDRYVNKLPLFGGLNKVRFRRQVLPGERLELYVETISLSALSGQAKGLATVGGEKACEAELMFVMAPK